MPNKIDKSAILLAEDKSAGKQEIPFGIELNPVETKEGELVPNTYSDITDRKRAEASLSESEARYHTLFNSLNEGFCIIEMIWDAAGEPVDYRFLEINPAFERQTGLLNAQGRLMRELVPDHEPLWFKIYGKIALTGEPAHFEAEAKALGRHFDVCAYRLSGPESQKVAILFNNITERKNAEEQLQASEARYRTLFEYSPDGIIIADAQGCYLDVNASACEMLGYSRAELIGMPSSKIVAESEIPHIGSALDTIRSRKDYYREWQLRRKDGSVFPADVVATLMPDGKVLAVVRDITERKKAELEIRTLNADLEQRVIKRTAQFEASNKELEAFCYSVSHDMRAPLRHVMGYVELLQQDAGHVLSDNSRRLLDTISKSAKWMGDLIDALLSFSRVGRVDIQKTDVNLGTLLRETLDEFQKTIKERNIVWKIDPLPTVQGDCALLRLVLINLISNAVKFTGARAEATIEIGCASAAGDETVFFIRDNGAGFDPRYAGKLFGVFQRLHSQNEFAGTGIGLANVQRIIHRHGGRIWAEGVVDGGATFYFSIPKQNENGDGI